MSSAFDWRAKAACRDKDPELFFPVGNTGAAYQQIEEAKAVCRTCKVIDACLKCALDTNQDYGVWGGLSEDERRALKRRAMRARRSQFSDSSGAANRRIPSECAEKCGCSAAVTQKQEKPLNRRIQVAYY